jgi:hypothetical protein
VKAKQGEQADRETLAAEALGADTHEVREAIERTPYGRRKAQKLRLEEVQRQREERERTFAEGRCPERKIYGLIIGRIGAGTYEFSFLVRDPVLGVIPHGEHAILRTKGTTFESRGRFEICTLQEPESRAVRMSNGFEQSVLVFTEDVP